MMYSSGELLQIDEANLFIRKKEMAKSKVNSRNGKANVIAIYSTLAIA